MIYIDPRVGSRHLLAALGNRGLPASLRQMDFGDVAFDLSGPEGLPIPVGMELKSISDMLSCITTKRFCGHQLPGLCRSYRIKYFIIEGAKREGPDGMLEVPYGGRWTTHPARMYYTDVMEWLTGIEVRAKVLLRFTYDTSDTASQIRALYKYGLKAWEDHNSFNVFTEPEELADGVTFEPILRRRRFAALLPGIGWEKSKSAAELFPSIGAMANATPEEWAKLEYGKKRRMKISLKTAVEIVKAIWA